MRNTRSVSRNRFTFAQGNRTLLVAAAFAVGIFFVISVFFNGPAVITPTAKAAQEFQGGATPEMLNYALNFGQASEFAVFGGRAVRNRGESTIRGRVGTTGTYENVPGMPDGAIPENYGQAKQDMKDALRWIAQLPCAEISNADLGGKTFGPGVYCLPSANLAGEMTLDGGGDANARFVFRIAGALSTGAGSNLRLAGGAKASSVYVIAGGDITLASESRINANLISNGTVLIGSGSTVYGKTIGVDGEVQMESSILGNGTGHIEICKNLSPGDPIPVGTIFSFTVTGIATPVQVPAGSCSNAVEVAAGNVTVTETARPNTAVISITTNPANRQVSSSLALRQVVVAIPEGDVTDETVVTFTNQTTRTGTIEICKRALGADVTGFFQFTVQGAPGQIFSVPVGGCSPAITVTTLQVPNTDFTINVTELARANFRLENVTTFPANRLNEWFPNLGFDANGNPIPNTNGGYANVDVISGGGVPQQTTVNFFNRALPGQIKVCKITADPALIPVGTLFRFTVSGLAPTSPTQTLPGVGVTRTVDVPAGPDSQGGFCEFVEGTFVVGEPVLVTETGLAPGQTLPGGNTFANVRVSRIRATTAFSPTPVTVQTAGGPVVVNAPNPNLVDRTAVFPARSTTAIVDFTNFIFRPAILKICKVAGPGVTPGTPFNFNVAAANPLTSFPVTTTPVRVFAGGCEFAQGPFPEDPNFPGIGTFNANTQLVVTEVATAGVGVTAITSPTGGPLSAVSLPNRTATILLNQSLLPNNLFNEIAFTNAATTPPVPPAQLAVRFDFDGDRKSDPVIFRPNTGTWWYSASSAGGQARATQFGLGTDRVVAADYDGDMRTDFAVYRNGQWHVLGSTEGYSVRTFGMAGDIPQPGDYDGDRRADLAVFRPSDATWHIMGSTSGYTSFRFGISTDSPEAADFDGDGRMDAAVYRDGTWYVLGSSAGVSSVQFGLAGDRPIAADYDGDGKADMAVYRNGVWHILRTAGGYVSFQFGVASDELVPADYDGDGKTDAAVYRPSNNVWHIMRSSLTEAAYTSVQFGSNGDTLMNY